VTETEFQYRLDNWLLDRPVRVTVTDENAQNTTFRRASFSILD